MYTAQSNAQNNVSCFMGDDLIANIIRLYFYCTGLFLPNFQVSSEDHQLRCWNADVFL